MKDANLILKELQDIQKYNGIWGVIIAIVVIIAFLLLWIFLKKSIESNAVVANNKNLERFKSELQESIGLKITQQQAEINRGLTAYKSELDRDLSKLTSELAINNSIRLEVKNEERRAIIEYLNAYSEWLYGSLEVQILDYEYQNYEDINDKLSEIVTAFYRTNIATNKLQFWTNNYDLVNGVLALNKKTLELSHFVQTKLGILRYNLGWGKMNRDSFERATKNVDNHSEYIKFLVSEDKRIEEENKQLRKDFWIGKLDLYGEVLKINNSFQTLAKKHLNEITNLM